MRFVNPRWVVCAATLLTALPALAEEGEAGGAALPQLDVAFYPGQLFWLAIFFSLFFVVMRFLAVPRVQKAQGDRRQTLETDLASAHIANEQAMGMMQAYESALAQAREKAQATVGGIVAKAAREAETQQAAQQEALENRVAAAEAKIVAARQTAIKEAPQVAGDLAKAIIARITQAEAA